MGTVKLTELEWWVQENDHIAASYNGTWTIYPVPTSSEATEKLLLQFWASVTQVGSIPQVSAWVDRTGKSAQLGPQLMHDLATVEVTQEPPGRCKLCPP
jgi:hypothetical protein